jgi:hypothetical protein
VRAKVVSGRDRVLEYVLDVRDDPAAATAASYFPHRTASPQLVLRPDS